MTTEELLAKCNCLVAYSSDYPARWMPAIRLDDGKFQDPRGIKIVAPDEWKSATPSEIKAYLAEHKLVFLMGDDAMGGWAA